MTRLAKDFDDTYTLVTDSQDIKDTLFAVNADRTEFGVGSLFVLIGEPDFLEVWRSDYCVPYLGREYTKIDL